MGTIATPARQPGQAPADWSRIPRSVWSLVPARIIRARLAFPVAVEGGSMGGRIVVAMADPSDLVALDEIAFASGRPVSPVPATPAEIRRAIAIHLDAKAPAAAPAPIDLPDEESAQTSDWLIPTAPGDTRWR